MVYNTYRYLASSMKSQIVNGAIYFIWGFIHIPAQSINNHLNIYHYGDITDYASSSTEPIKI